MNKRIISVLLASILLVSLGACGSSSSAPSSSAPVSSAAPAGSTAPASSADAKLPSDISFATGGTSGTFYLLGSTLAPILPKYIQNVSVSVQATAAAIENTRLVSAGDVTFAFLNGEGAYYGYLGGGPYPEGEQHPRVRKMADGHVSPVQIATLKQTGITSLQDLKGKKVGVGAPGSPAGGFTAALLKAHGLNEGDYTPVEMSYAEQIDALKDGSLHSIAVQGGFPTSSIMDLATTHNMVMLSADPEAMKQCLEENPLWFSLTIPKEVYNQPEDTLVVSGASMLITRDDAPDELVYLVMKAIYENLDELRVAHPVWDEWTPESAVRLEPCIPPRHPGAEKYLKEVGALK